MPSRCLLVLLDGLGDRGQECFGGLTPLQAAATPALDRLAALGSSGLWHASFPGQALPSENAHFSLFGYGDDDFPGRGALEALGADVDLGPRDVAVLTHLVTAVAHDGYLVLAHGRPAVTEAEARELFAALDGFEHRGVRVRVHPTEGHRALLILHGDVSPYVTDSDPILEGRPLSDLLPWQEHVSDRASRATAGALEAFHVAAFHALDKHPVNDRIRGAGRWPATGIVTQRAGQRRPICPFSQRFGLRALSVASGILYPGLAGYLGFDVERVPDTDDPGRDLAERVEMGRVALQERGYDFVHVHTKAPDEAGHRRDPEGKRAVIEDLDRGLAASLGPLVQDPETVIVVTADHCTPSSGTLIHSGEWVPVVMAGSGVRRDGVERFDEVSVAGGALGCLRGRELMYLILNHVDKAKLVGLRETQEDLPYWPAPTDHLRDRPRKKGTP